MLQPGSSWRVVTAALTVMLFTVSCGSDGRSADALCGELDSALVDMRVASTAPEWMASADLAVLTGDSDATLRLLERLVRRSPPGIYNAMVNVTQTWANMTTGVTAVAPTMSLEVVDAVVFAAPVDTVDAWAIEQCGQPILRGSPG